MIAPTEILEFRALIADDDKMVCRMVADALTREGFYCQTATDGVHALALLKQKPYDLVTVDLHMPHKNGHSLVCELMQEELRPAVMVHTAVEDPHLTKDLTFRGVEDVSFKPTNYTLLAARARGLAERRREEHGDKLGDPNIPREMLPVKANLTNGIRVAPTRVFKRLSKLEAYFPLSHAYFDAYSLASRVNASAEELTRVIERDEFLTKEVLKLANAEQHSLEGEEITDLEKAIILLGCQRIAELAIMSGARQAVTKFSVPWLDSELLWKRSLAAASTVRMIQKTQFTQSDDSAFLCALLHPIGRIILATLFPEEHEQLTEHCLKTGESLDQAEEAAFGLSYGQIASRFFSTWRVPVTSRLPLEHLTHSFDEMISIPDPARRQIEIVKLSLVLSRVALSLWQPYDLIDLPLRTLLNKLNMPSIQRSVALIQEACDFEILPQELRPEITSEPFTQEVKTLIEYISSTGTTSDILYPLLGSLGLNIHDHRLELSHLNLVDGVSLTGKQLREFIESQKLRDFIGVVRNKRDASLFKPDAVICLPTTIKKINQFLDH